MNIDHVLERINAAGPSRAGAHFEIFVQNLLVQHFNRFGKKYVSSNEMGESSLDGYMTEGFDGMEGPVGFEIRYVRQPNTSVVQNLLYYLDQLMKEYKLRHLIIIIPFLSDFAKRQIAQKGGPQMVVWEKDRLDEFIQEDEENAAFIVRNLFKLDLENELKNRNDHWEESRKEILGQVRDAYFRGNIALILGAGVSCSAGFPDWQTLLNSLYANFVARIFKDRHFPDCARDAVTDLLIGMNSYSALAAARYLKAGLSHDDGQDTEFIQAVKEALYDHTVYKESKLLDEIVRLCQSERNGAKVKSIITYNFDDLIETQLQNAAVAYRTVYDENELHDADELPIYHVHGYISRNGGLESGHSLVFSEETYHQVYAEPYHWSNLVQLATFRENHCLMIGLSMNDPNLRRLLEIAARKYSHEKRHYVFMKRLDGRKLTEGKPLQDFDGDSVDKIWEIHHTIQEMMMESLGIRIIWFRDYDEIPVLLEQIRKKE